jgi:hypothetical protein
LGSTPGSEQAPESMLQVQQCNDNSRSLGVLAGSTVVASTQGGGPEVVVLRWCSPRDSGMSVPTSETTVPIQKMCVASWSPLLSGRLL